MQAAYVLATKNIHDIKNRTIYRGKERRNQCLRLATLILRALHCWQACVKAENKDGRLNERTTLERDFCISKHQRSRS